MELEILESRSQREPYLYAQNGVSNYKGQPALKRRTGKWFGCFPMLVIQLATTVIFFGIISNLVTYMTGVLHHGVAQSARDINNWQGTLFVSSVLGAFLSDTFWGRYRTMTYFFVLYCLGLSCLTISASVKSLRPPSCPAQNYTCQPATTGQSAFFFLSLYAIAVASGSITACVMSFGADQFDESDDVERRQKYSFFNSIVGCTSIGGLISVTGLVYVEDHVGWSWGFGILLIFISLAMFIFVIQTPRYRYRQPEGSPLTKITQVLVAAIRKRKHAVFNEESLYEEEEVAKGKRRVPHTNEFRFLDKAALVTEQTDVKASSPWILCTVTRAEEVKLVLRMLPIWIATLWFTTAPSQSTTFFLRQGMTMDNMLGSFKVPPASMLVFSNLATIVFLPVYDRVFVPMIRKVTKDDRGISLLQRTGAGIFLSIVALVIAALVEIKRKHVEAPDRLSIFWLVPQYVVLGGAEGLATTSIIEFFHDQAPDTFHSLGVSLALANLGVGSFLSSALISAVNEAVPAWLQNDVNKGHLDNFYWLLAALSMFNLMFYVPLARWYSYKDTEEYAETV